MNPYHGLQFPLGPLPINAAGQSGQRFNQLDKILLDENNVRRLWPHDHNGSTGKKQENIAYLHTSGENSAHIIYFQVMMEPIKVALDAI